MGSDPQQTLVAFREAEAYDGPSLIIAYSHCIAHGIEMRNGLDQQYRAVASGYWPLIRYDPMARAAGGNPFLLDSPRPRIPLADYTDRERAAWPWRGTVLAVRLIRLLSVLLGAGTVYFTYRLALELMPEQTGLALAAAGFAAFTPMFLFISASVNNDNPPFYSAGIAADGARLREPRARLAACPHGWSWAARPSAKFRPRSLPHSGAASIRIFVTAFDRQQRVTFSLLLCSAWLSLCAGGTGATTVVRRLA
jgi:hypothetical protein